MGAGPRYDNAQTKYTNEQNDEYDIILQKIQFGEIFINIVHQYAKPDQSNYSSNHAEFNVGPYKWSSDKGFGRPYHLHGFDDESFGIDGQSDGAVDQQNRDDRENGAGHQYP